MVLPTGVNSEAGALSTVKPVEEEANTPLILFIGIAIAVVLFVV
jgi:hypothetical protein